MKCLEVARAKQSLQTGFLHDEDVIPIYENLCFSLALFRTHTTKQVEEGKKLLKRLLSFFSKGFPFYLHDYPNIALPTYQIRCALPLYWILKLYHHVIETPLKKSLMRVYKELIQQEKDVFSPFYQILFCALHGKEIRKCTPRFSYEWGLLLLAYQILDERPLWILDEALAHWHSELMVYSGPPVQEYQRKTQPEVNLYDLFMSEYQKTCSTRIIEFYPVQGALVFPFKERRLQRLPSSLQIVEEKKNWNKKGFHLMRLIWGSADWIRSLVCQSDMCLKRKGDQLQFFYPKDTPGEKDRIELSFFTEYDVDTQILIEGKRQTVFYLDETITIQTSKKIVQLRLSLEKGEGNFIGHIKRGNRPAQVAITDLKDFSSYDWQIDLHSISRSNEVVISLHVLQL